MRTVVVGTAGHIDHGKTSLLRALTGIDADRLPEEQARGMTIDVGYAHVAYDDGVELDFVDVPGHDRLIGNMLVGAGEIDAALLVVAADDGPRPQTIEHLQLLDALQIRAGVAVVTKVDLVDPERVAAVTAELQVLLAATSLASVPVLGVSSTSGEGIEELRIALRALSDQVLAQRDSSAEAGKGGPARFAIDRAFTAKGRGVVVTGTLRGSIARGAWLRREPGGELVRVRELQVHNEPRTSFGGGRVAFNVAGAAAVQLHRGDVLSGGDRSTGVRGVERLLIRLRPPAQLGPLPNRSVGARSSLRLHLGTAQVDATLRRLPATEMLAVLKLSEPIATFSGDRGVLREPASGDVVAGVRVLDLDPPRGPSRRRLSADRLERLAAAVDSGRPEDVAAARLDLHGALPADIPTSPRSAVRSFRFAEDVRASLEAAALGLVAAHHRQSPVSAGLPLARARAGLLRQLRKLVTIERDTADLAGAATTRLVADLVADGRLARDGDSLRDPARGAGRPPELSAAMDRLEAALAVPAPPALDEAAAAADCSPEGVRALVAEGRIVRLGPDLAWATPTYHALAAVALERARVAPLTPAAYRDATGTSRKFVMALLEDFDRRDILRRTPEGHVPGPRAPRATAKP